MRHIFCLLGAASLASVKPVHQRGHKCPLTQPKPTPVTSVTSETRDRRAHRGSLSVQFEL